MPPTLLQSLFNQPSRSYNTELEGQDVSTPYLEQPLNSTQSPPGDARVHRRHTEYYSSAADPRLRKEWERILERRQPRRTISSTIPSTSRIPPRTTEEVTALAESEDEVFYTPQNSPIVSPKSCLSCDIDESMDSMPRGSSVTSSSSRSDGTYTNYSWSDHRSQETMTTISSSSSKGKQARASVVLQEQWTHDVRFVVPPAAVAMFATAPSRRGRPNVKRRMSAVIEAEEDDDVHTSQISSSSIRGRVNGVVKRSRSGAQRSASVSSTLVVSSPPQVGNGVPSSSSGYSGLVLPRAAYTPAKHPDRVSNQIDITRSGLAQTTMAAISISKHGAEAALTRRLSFKMTFARSLSFSSSSTSLPIPSLKTPTHLLSSLPSPLSFTSHMSPPTKLQSGQVLVQVFAVALDKLDYVMVREKSQKVQGYGYVPGRSFVGRIVEFGWEVTNVGRGDWVFGLLEVRQCGALSEFIVVDRRRVTLCPIPTSTLTLEQIAAIPLCGVPAHRALKTFLYAGAEPDSDEDELGDFKGGGRKALVLGASEGAGAIVTQELCRMGMRVTVQVSSEDSCESAKTPKVTLKTRMALYGAKEIKEGDASTILASFPDDSFDMIFDNVGGRDIWQLSKRILRTNGQFTTVVGDSYESATSRSAHFRSNLRSLSSAFGKQDSSKKKKVVGYEWTSAANELEDVRDSLRVIGKLAVAGLLLPWFSKGIKFERVPEEFGSEAECLLRGGTVVVTVAGG